MMMTTLQTVELQRRKLNYRAAGNGERAFVCIHGMGQSSLYWEKCIGSLPPGWQGFALDLLGFGDSEQIPTGYSIDFHARMVAEFISQLPQRHVVLGANSLGGVVAMALAIQALVPLKGLFLTATGPNVRNPDGLRAYRARLAEMDLTVEHLRSIVSGFFFRAQPAEDIDKYAAAMAKAHRVAMVETLASSLETDLVPNLGKIRVPTLILQGMEDKGRTVEDGLVVAGGVVDGRLVVLPRVGHTPMIDAPQEFQHWLNTTLERWTGG